MLQPRYVRELLLDLVGVRYVGPEDRPDEPSEAEADVRAEQRRLLERAATRAFWAILLDVAALLVLLGWRLGTNQAVLPFGRSEESVFTLGVIAVAIHLGFRLAQRFWLNSALQAWDDLPD